MIPAIAIIISAYAIARLVAQAFHHRREISDAEAMIVFLVSAIAIGVIVWQLWTILGAGRAIGTFSIPLEK